MRGQTITSALLLAFTLVAVPLGSAMAENLAAPHHARKVGKFEDVWQDLKDAVINRGLVIDYVGQVDKMLERTSTVANSVTVTGSQSPYLHAKYLQFCSSKLTHAAVSANPYNLAICPYVVFAFEVKTKPGEIIVGYRRPVAGPSKRTRAAVTKIDTLLDGIVKEATTAQ